MTTDHEFINTIVDYIIDTIDDNSSSLGNLNTTEEKDEHPALAPNPPQAFVIPIGEGADSMKGVQGGVSNWHSFPIQILAVYKYHGRNQLATALRTTRNYGYLCNALFTGENQTLTENAVVKSSALKVNYWMMVDYEIHSFLITLDVRAVNG